jgi:hypothetical protein
VPSSETIAGIRVRPASSVTATAIASDGPIDLNRPRLERVSARKAMITAPAAEAIASPTRVTALIIACLASSPARSRSRYRNIRNRM